VHWKGAWNAHQFHPWTEFFADYGVYDVRLTLPRGFVVGATGRLQERADNPDGTQTLRFVQEDVHDFAWTASRRYLERTARFDDPGYPLVDIRLLLQPEHAHLAERYIEATRVALRSYGAWSAPYPYPQITVVDPAWTSGAGGMEYPTLFTGGASVWSPAILRSPEGVTIHEAGHQFWYGLVANNEFEEAWLDEGFNSYHDEKAEHVAMGARGMGSRYFGLRGAGRGSRGGWPVVAPGVFIGRGEGTLSSLRRHGETDVMARRGWEYRTSESYTINSYGKPALSLQTLEGLLGDETMTRVLRTYARRHRFGHPTSQDFMAVVNEVTGQDYRWFFDETWFSSELCDYAVAVRNDPVRDLEGFTEG
ncbi:MAG TPA: M1 family metallopeptidase, partial [Vicinamibacteria bacterium]|nr:M1 family metallopeptidase [Vicinamibacteria bacterium]